MRVLFISPVDTSKKAEGAVGSYNGIGWVGALQKSLKNDNEILLGVVFTTTNILAPFMEDNVKYYPIKQSARSPVHRLLSYWGLIRDVKNGISSEELESCIRDFRPDIIQVFGIESQLVKPLLEMDCEIPVLVHLQGLLQPCANAFYPPGFSRVISVLFGHRIRELVLRNGLDFAGRDIARRADGEGALMKKLKFVSGRTEWDYLVTRLLAPNAAYFRVNELLRSAFYNAKPWESASRKRCVVLSTISDTMYKGFDLILKTSNILRRLDAIEFEWHVAGVNESSLTAKLFQKKLALNAKDLGVKLLGVLDADELAKEMQEASLYVHPSYIDNSPNSLCEAQLLGLPVIACNVGGVSSLVTHNESGLMVPSNDPFRLAYYIIELFQNRDLVSRLSSLARETALKRHNQERVIMELKSAYTAIIKARSI